MMARPNFLILSGDGINCERETAHAFTLAGASAEIIHVNDLLANAQALQNFSGMALPGGFSFADELGSGQVMALKLRYGMGKEFSKFIREKRPIIGICNGFQILVKLGLLPFPHKKRNMALAMNRQEKFIDKWVKLQLEKTVCKWVKYLPSSFELPIRHKEGRITLFPQHWKEEIGQRLSNNGQVVFRYVDDENGSWQNMAGVCDPSGTILGMMPHPEACLYAATTREKKKNPLEKGVGFFLFKSIVEYLKEKR